MLPELIIAIASGLLLFFFGRWYERRFPRKGPQPSIRATWPAGSREVEISADWTRRRSPTPSLLTSMTDRLNHYDLPPGTAPFMIEIMNEGDVGAINPRVIIQLPENCSIPEYSNSDLFLKSDWDLLATEGSRDIQFIGPSLTHELKKRSRYAHITYPKDDQVYVFSYRGYADNQTIPTKGELKIRMLPKETRPTERFPGDDFNIELEE